MAQFTLTIDTDNAAFQDGNRGKEIAHILAETARRVLNDTEAMGYSFAIQDSNGNTVGRAEMREHEYKGLPRCDRCDAVGPDGKPCPRCGGQGMYRRIDHERIHERIRTHRGEAMPRTAHDRLPGEFRD